MSGELKAAAERRRKSLRGEKPYWDLVKGRKR